jgi:peptidoglycan/xylan/chitin deacetylase (PgdA/CDA1 family)
MKTVEGTGIKMYFFFIAGGHTKFEKRYSILGKAAKELMQKIKERGHYIGIHPSFNTYKFPEQMKEEVDTLKEVTGEPVLFGRQHYLRFEVPTTWKQWDDNDIQWDSTLTYADQLGFRAGTCIAFPVFDILNRKVLQLEEKPLTVMDQTLINYLKLDKNSAFKEVNDYIEIIKKYKGDFVLLWHNSSFNTPEMRPYRGLFEKIVKASK